MNIYVRHKIVKACIYPGGLGEGVQGYVSVRYVPHEFKRVFDPNIRHYIQKLSEQPHNQNHPTRFYFKDRVGWLRVLEVKKDGFFIRAARMNGNRCGYEPMNKDIDPLIPIVDELWRTEELSQALKLIARLKEMGLTLGRAYELLKAMSEDHDSREIGSAIKKLLPLIRPDKAAYDAMETRRVDSLKRNYRACYINNLSTPACCHVNHLNQRVAMYSTLGNLFGEYVLHFKDTFANAIVPKEAPFRCPEEIYDILDAVKSDKVSTRLSAIDKLQKLGKDAAPLWAALVWLLNDNEDAIRMRAMKMLASIDTPFVNKVMCRAYANRLERDRDPTIRMFAARLLGKAALKLIKHRQSSLDLELIMTFLKSGKRDSNQMVRECATDVLRKINSSLKGPGR